MVQITIQIDGDKVTINQSDTSTKVENTNKKYFIIIGECNAHSYVEFVTENYIEAITKLKSLRYSSTDDNYSYSLHVQRDGICYKL